MWAPSQGVSRIPCLRFELQPSLTLFSQPSVRQTKETRSGDPAHCAAGGSLRRLAA